MRRGQRKGLILLISSVVIFAIAIFLLVSFVSKSPKRLALEAVSTFYTFEQDGSFAESWAMFHPMMQEKLPKVYYLQDRVHVFLNHFGVATFTFTLSDAVEVKNWKMAEEAESIESVYLVTVSQLFKGKYGNFTIVQDVYVVEIDGEWKVLWDYS